MEGFSISGANPIAQGHVVPLRVIELSQDVHFEILFGSQVRQFEACKQTVHFEGFAVSYTCPGGHGQVFVALSNPVELESQVRHSSGFVSQVKQLEDIVQVRDI